MKRIEDIKKFEDIDTYYEISKIVDEVFQDRVEAHKHLVTANKEIEKLENIIKDIKSQLDYLETYSSKEDVFEDMKRRLDRIESIVNRK